jgi:hypothetical protein
MLFWTVTPLVLRRLRMLENVRFDPEHGKSMPI